MFLNSVTELRGETLIDIPLLRFERGISRARNYEQSDTDIFSVDVDRVKEGEGVILYFRAKVEVEI